MKIIKIGLTFLLLCSVQFSFANTSISCPPESLVQAAWPQLERIEQITTQKNMYGVTTATQAFEYDNRGWYVGTFVTTLDPDTILMLAQENVKNTQQKVSDRARQSGMLMVCGYYAKGKMNVALTQMDDEHKRSTIGMTERLFHEE